jgi:hypothetical protein
MEEPLTIAAETDAVVRILDASGNGQACEAKLIASEMAFEEHDGFRALVVRSELIAASAD